MTTLNEWMRNPVNNESEHFHSQSLITHILFKILNPDHKEFLIHHHWLGNSTIDSIEFVESKKKPLESLIKSLPNQRRFRSQSWETLFYLLWEFTHQSQSRKLIEGSLIVRKFRITLCLNGNSVHLQQHEQRVRERER